jgi:LysR family transcriptional activator of glutamate synthase operon
MLLRDLAWLVALADHEHVTDTAAALRTSQPTLSRALARIETELGAQIFERAADGVHPTPNGRLVIEAARELTARYRQLQTDLASVLDPNSGVVRLAFLDSIATSLVPRLLRAFHEHAPRVRVLLSQEPAHEIIHDLGTAAVDLAVTSWPPPGAYGWHPLQDERLVVIVPSTHRWRRRKQITLAELADEQLVVTPVGYGYRTLIDTLLREAAIAPVVSFESQDLATIEGLVAAGLGVAIVPEQFAGQSGTIGIRIAGDSAHRTIGLIWRSDRTLPAPAARFRDLATSTAMMKG